jgi:hypothetical protein
MRAGSGDLESKPGGMDEQALDTAETYFLKTLMWYKNTSPYQAGRQGYISPRRVYVSYEF